MKADAAQQSILLDLAEADAELTRLAHRRSHLPGEKERTELQARQLTLVDAVAALGIALEDLDAQVSKVDSEVAAVRQREDRDRALLDGGTVGAKELTEIQHELETLERRQSALEDSELELMERREELQGQQAEAQASTTSGTSWRASSTGSATRSPRSKRLLGVASSAAASWLPLSTPRWWNCMSGNAARAASARESCRATSAVHVA